MAEQTGNKEAQAGIRAFDQNGREVVVPREQWAGEVLPGLVREVWDQPDQLYGLVVNSLNDGFVAEIAEAAEHLQKTDPMPARGACMWAIVLLQQGRLDEAEGVLDAAPQQDASVLMNRAKLYAMRGDAERADATLWRSIELEPNFDNSLGWYASTAAERGAAAANGDQRAGEQAATEALRKVAAMPASWRAQLWLARAELAAGNLAGARTLYREALGRVARPVPPDFLMQMSGDLGGGGHLGELIELTAPEYVAEVHGLPIGNNLVKAFVDTGDLVPARAIVDRLKSFERPDWTEALAFWDGELTRRGAGAATLQPAAQPAQQTMQIGMLRVDGPVWLPPQSPARVLFAGKPGGGPSVTFLGGTAEYPEGGGSVQTVEAAGRMTRALPLFLAEQADLRTAAQGRAMLPWAVAAAAGQPSGFVIGSARWPDEVAVQMVSEPENRTDYVVTVHVDAEVEPWTAELAFVRTADGIRIGELQAEFEAADASAGLMTLAGEMTDLLSALGRADVPANYKVPTEFGAYLLELEQLLMVRTNVVQGAIAMSADAQRGVLAGQLDVCEVEPSNLPARLLLIETLGVLTQTSADVAQEFGERFQRLIQDKPIPELDRVFAQVAG